MLQTIFLTKLFISSKIVPSFCTHPVQLQCIWPHWAFLPELHISWGCRFLGCPEGWCHQSEEFHETILRCLYALHMQLHVALKIQHRYCLCKSLDSCLFYSPAVFSNFANHLLLLHFLHSVPFLKIIKKELSEIRW